MKQIKGYKIDTRLFFIPIIVVLPLLLLLIYEEGFSVVQETKTYQCPENSYMDCEFINGEVLQPGEIKIVNMHKNPLIKVVNYLPWIMIALVLIYNHFKNN